MYRALGWQKEALGKIEKKLLDSSAPWAAELAPNYDRSEQTQHYIKEFGCMQMHEAQRLGIDVYNDFAYTQWTSYESNEYGPSPIDENVHKGVDGKPIGWLEKKTVTKGRTLYVTDERGVKKEVQGPDVVRPRGELFAPQIRKKYKKKAEPILAFLLKMHAEYVDHPGTHCVCHTAPNATASATPRRPAADMATRSNECGCLSRLCLAQAVAQGQGERAEQERDGRSLSPAHEQVPDFVAAPRREKRRRARSGKLEQ